MLSRIELKRDPVVLAVGGGDARIGDLDVCYGPAWQVGLSGIQSGSVALSTAEAVAQRAYPGKSIEAILYATAKQAGVDEGTAQAIAQSTGDLRKSWLLRDPAVAFPIQRPLVEQGCLNGNASWCYGSWDTARRFAGDASMVREVIGSLEARFSNRGIVLPLAAATAVGLAAWDWTRKGSLLRKYLT